jgi:hypothetical protein
VSNSGTSNSLYITDIPLKSPTVVSYTFTAARTDKREGGALLCIIRAVSGLPTMRLNVRGSLISNITNITYNININY